MTEDFIYGDISKVIEEDWGAKLFRVVNSTNCFVAAYLLTVLLFQFTTGMSGAITGYNVWIYHHEVRMPFEFHLWSKWRVLFVYSSGTVSSLVLGIVASSVYHRIQSKDNIWSLFFFWLYINAIIMILAQVLICAIGTDSYGTPFYANLAVVMSWLQLPGEFAVFLSLPVLLFVILLGNHIMTPFLSFSFSNRLVINQRGRRQYFVQVACIPFLLGCAIISPLFFPKALLLHAINFGCLLLMLVSALVQLDSVDHIESNKNTSIQNLSWIMLTVVVILIAFFVTFMASGIAL